MLYNYTNEDFICNWDGVPYCFKAGQVYDGVVAAQDNLHSVVLNEVVSKVFSHHLAVKVLNTPSLDQNFRINSEGKPIPTAADQMKFYNMTTIEALIEKGIKSPSEAVTIPAFVNDLPLLSEPEAEDLSSDSSVIAEEAPKKRGRPAKAKVEESASPSPDAEFVNV